MLNSINVNTNIIMGGETNARIGTRTCKEHMQVLGPHGITRSNARGENLLHVIAGHKLRIENTFFKHCEEDYATYTSILTVHYPHGIPSMHDVFACSQSFHKRIHDCKMTLHGVASDHKTVSLQLALSSVKYKVRDSMKVGTINWPKILNDEHTRMVYNKHLLSLTTPGINYDDYQETILNAGKLTATYHTRQCPGWFQLSRTTLSPLLMERNEVLHATNRCHHLPAAIQATMRTNLKQLNRHIAHAVSHAKATWYAAICQKIHDMNMDPKLAWEHIRLLTKGETAHHQCRSIIIIVVREQGRGGGTSSVIVLAGVKQSAPPVGDNLRTRGGYGMEFPMMTATRTKKGLG
jgi:hypothetical protein